MIKIKYKIQNSKNFNLNNLNLVHTDVGNIEYLDLSFKETNVLFDIIIDDSSHFLEHQNNIIQTVSKHLKPGGILIIEDINREENINVYKIDEDIWEFYSFIICHHNNRYCFDNDKILYLIKK